MEPETLYAQIRANIAFEHMVAAVLIAAALSGGVVFLLSLAEAIVSERLGYSALFDAFFAAIQFSFFAFLIGFFSVVAVGLPLFLALEKIKLRKVWPYVAAGAAIEIVAAGFVIRRIPLAVDFVSFENAPLLLPGLLAALLFGRRMKPLWREAERENESMSVYPFGGSGL